MTTSSNLPTQEGWYFCKGVIPFTSGEKWCLVRVFRPHWIDADRRDLRWKYVDGSGGDDERFDFKPGQEWSPAVPQSAADELRLRIKSLEDLVGHCWVHSGYPDCGYQQMDSEMRALYDQVKALPDDE